MLYEKKIPEKLSYLDVMGGRLYGTTTEAFVAVMKATIIGHSDVRPYERFDGAYTG